MSALRRLASASSRALTAARPVPIVCRLARTQKGATLTRHLGANARAFSLTAPSYGKGACKPCSLFIRLDPESEFFFASLHTADTLLAQRLGEELQYE